MIQSFQLSSCALFNAQMQDVSFALSSPCPTPSAHMCLPATKHLSVSLKKVIYLTEKWMYRPLQSYRHIQKWPCLIFKKIFLLYNVFSFCDDICIKQLLTIVMCVFHRQKAQHFLSALRPNQEWFALCKECCRLAHKF